RERPSGRPFRSDTNGHLFCTTLSSIKLWWQEAGYRDRTVIIVRELKPKTKTLKLRRCSNQADRNLASKINVLVCANLYQEISLLQRALSVLAMLMQSATFIAQRRGRHAILINLERSSLV